MNERDVKILMIDDDGQILFALGEVFRFQGWQSFTAQDVNEGLALFRQYHPNLVLIDYHMPGINGVRGVEMLRELDPEVPIIVFTIDESQELADRFLEAGASDFALKPVKAPDMISRIRLHIRLMESTRRLNKPVPLENRVAVKGIDPATLELISSTLAGKTDYLTVPEIAQLTGLAQQTTYRYVQHMLAEDRLEVKQIYGKVGRPKQAYRLV